VYFCMSLLVFSSLPECKEAYQSLLAELPTHLLSRQLSTVGSSTSDAAIRHSGIYKHMLRSRAVGASVRNGMNGPVIGAALTNAEPPELPPVVPLGLEAPSLHLLSHALLHREFTVNCSTACATSASSDLFISVISKPRALPTIMEQLLWITATMYVQVTMGTGVVVVVGALASLRAVVVSKPSSHGVLASSHCEPRHSRYATIMAGLVAFDGTAQACMLVIVVVVVVVLVTAHDVTLLWTVMAAIFVPRLHAVHIISEALATLW